MIDAMNISLPYPDVINLIDLSERIKNSAKRKRAEKERTNDPIDILQLPMSSSSNPSGVERKSNPRRRYQEYFQTRQQAAVIIDEYLSSQPFLRQQQVN